MNITFALRFIYRSAQGIYCSLSDLYGTTLSSSKDGVLFLLAEPTQIQLLVFSKDGTNGSLMEDNAEKVPLLLGVLSFFKTIVPLSWRKNKEVIIQQNKDCCDP